jgi:hypothetical protein
MTKYWLASTAALAMMSGVALAQTAPFDSSTTTQSTTTTTVAPLIPGTFSSSKTQQTIDGNGTETDKTQTFKSGSGGTDATSSMQTKAPDGSSVSTFHEEGKSPAGDSSSTTTTTIGR